jgi:hypothetical protein
VPFGPGGVDADQQDMVEVEFGLEVVAEARLVPGIGREQACRHVVERDVVVARQRQQPRHAQRIAEAPRSGELVAAGALGDVAAQDDGVGPLRAHQRLDGGHHRRLLGAEVGVGDVQQHRHPAAA